MYCGNCGAELNENDRYCGRCGMKTPNQIQPSSFQPMPSVASNTVSGIASVFDSVRMTVSEAIAPITAKQTAIRAHDNDWKVTLDIEKHCPLLQTSRFDNEVTFYIQPDGCIWFDTVPDDLFEFVYFAWDGPNIEQKTIASSTGASSRKGRAAGAVAGGMVARGVGAILGGPAGGLAVTAAGAALGAIVGNGNADSHEDAVVKTKTVEHKSIADITLRSVYSGQIGTISVKGKSRQFGPSERILSLRSR